MPMTTPSRRPPLLHLATLVFDSPLAILPEKLDTILRAVGPRLVPDQAAVQELLDAGILRYDAIGIDDLSVEGLSAAQRRRRLSNSAWDGSAQEEEKPYQLTSSGVAVIPISGVLLKSGGWMSALSGCSSYEGIGQALAAAMADPTARAVLFDINSPGGTTHGCFELADQIYAARGTKPMYAVANDLAASAAYALASSADKLFLTRTAAVGSVGVFALHVDQAAADEQAGLKYTYVYNGERKVDGNPHAPLSKSAKLDIQAEVDREADIFQRTVARNRGATQQQIADTNAGVFFADLAIPLLADAVGTFDDALAELSSKIDGTGVMILSKGAPTGAEAATEALTEAKGVTDMAQITAIEEARAKLEAAQAELTALEAACDPGKADDAGAKKGKKAAEPKKEPDGDEKDEPDGDEAKKKAAVSALAPAPTAVTPAAVAQPVPDPAAAAIEISELCALAGRDADTGRFLRERKTVAEVRRLLAAERAAKSAEVSVSTSFGTVSTESLSTIEQQAAVLVASAPPGTLSKSRAMERVLRTNPSLYRKYDQERSVAAMTPDAIDRYVGLVRPQIGALGLSTEISGA